MNSIKAINKSPECFLFFIFCILLFWGGCTAGYSSIKPDGKKYEKIANESFKGEITYIFNEPKNHVICLNTKKTSSAKPHPEMDFFIYDIDADSIVYKQSSVNASVKWLSDFEVDVEIIPEIINDDTQTKNNSYIFDIVKKKKVSK